MAQEDEIAGQVDAAVGLQFLVDYRRVLRTDQVLDGHVVDIHVPFLIGVDVSNWVEYFLLAYVVYCCKKLIFLREFFRS